MATETEPDVSAATIAAAIRETSDDSSSASFAFKSIADIQSTIRAIDTKMGILLAALAIPLKDAVVAIHAWQGTASWLRDFALVAAILCYLGAIALALATLSGIGSAHAHVEGSPEVPTFFAGGLYPLSARDALVRRRRVRSRIDFAEFERAMPRNSTEIRRELAAEIMMLAYIRDLKLLRQRFAFGLTGASLLLGFVAII